jgi:hypothetical protein
MSANLAKEKKLFEEDRRTEPRTGDNDRRLYKRPGTLLKIRGYIFTILFALFITLIVYYYNS